MNIFYIIFNFFEAFFESIHPQLKSNDDDDLNTTLNNDD
jgi:hypothetical protein